MESTIPAARGTAEGMDKKKWWKQDIWNIYHVKLTSHCTQSVKSVTLVPSSFLYRSFPRVFSLTLSSTVWYYYHQLSSWICIFIAWNFVDSRNMVCRYLLFVRNMLPIDERCRKCKSDLKGHWMPWKNRKLMEWKVFFDLVAKTGLFVQFIQTVQHVLSTSSSFI